MPSNILSSNSFINAAEVKSSYSKDPVDLLKNNDPTTSTSTSTSTSAIKQAKVIQETEQLLVDSKAVDQKAEVSADELNQAIEIVSAFINQPPRNINFVQDDDSGKTVIKVFDNSSKELIKQFPSEELVSLAQKIRALHQQVDEQTGILLDTSV